MRSILLPVAIAISLAGCATGPSKLESILTAIPEAQRAYVVGSYSVDCTVNHGQCAQAFNSIAAAYRMVGSIDVRGELDWVSGSMFRKDPAPDYVNGSEGHKGFHFCLALPPGEYEFYSLSFYNFAGGGSGYWVREKDHFSVPFAAKAGRLTNIGKIRVTTAAGKNIFGMPLPAPGLMLLSDTASSETTAAVAKCPEAIRDHPIESVTLRSVDGKPSPFVRRAP